MMISETMNIPLTKSPVISSYRTAIGGLSSMLRLTWNSRLRMFEEESSSFTSC